MNDSDMQYYTIFHRTWWRDNPEWPNGLEPDIGRSYKISERLCTESEAISYCKIWNDSRANRYGKYRAARMLRLSDKAEFTANY